MNLTKVYCDNHETEFMEMEQISKGNFKDEKNNTIHFAKFRCLVHNCSSIITIYLTHKGNINKALEILKADSIGEFEKQ